MRWHEEERVDARRRRPPDSLGAVLGDVLARRGWQRRLEGARVHDAWGEIAGEELAAHAEPVRLHGGVLVVRAATPAWATQLRYLCAELADRANAVLGEGSVETVTVVVGSLRGFEEEPL